VERTIYLTKIEIKIKESNNGETFVCSDFSDIADNQAIRKALSRLEKEGTIRRILHGIYEYPEYNEFLGEYVAPSPDKVAHALARNYGWTIVPCGDTALNLLGLSTQVPAVWSYVSDGTIRIMSLTKLLSSSKELQIKKYQRYHIKQRWLYRH
jgi:predicted transcriptional regulator of viral defense system